MTKLGFIGCGNMHQAIIRGLLQQKVVRPEDVLASDHGKEKLKEFSEEVGILAASNNLQVVKEREIIFLGTKPQDMCTVVDEIAPHVTKDHVIVSIAAGVPISFFKNKIPQARAHVRVMPNTPCMVRAGIVAFFIKPHDAKLAELLIQAFSPLGEVVQVKDDHDINVITAGAASGSGFVFELMNEFAKWFHSQGFDLHKSRALAVQTFYGAALQAGQLPDKSLEDLRISVTSKKGTTEAGLNAFKTEKLDHALKAGLEAALKRGEEISKSFS